MAHDIDVTRLVEEVPGVPADEAWYIWSGRERRTVWTGPTMDAAKLWASANNIEIEEVERFEP